MYANLEFVAVSNTLAACYYHNNFYEPLVITFIKHGNYKYLYDHNNKHLVSSQKGTKSSTTYITRQLRDIIQNVENDLYFLNLPCLKL